MTKQKRPTRIKRPTTSPRSSTFEWKTWERVVPQYIRNICFAWQFVKYTFIFYLCYRQHKVLDKHHHIPRVLFGKLPPETFESARNYQMALNYLKMFTCFWYVLREVWIILYAGFTQIWFLSGPAMDALGIWPDTWDLETGESVMFLFLLDLHIHVINLPLDLYRIFAIEEKYGFNRMSLKSYMWDWFYKICIQSVFTCVTGVFILWIVRETGTYFFLWLWIFSFFWLLLTLAIYPNFIAPLFDTYTPLREGRLKTRLEKLAKFLGFPLEEIVVLLESLRSVHKDAYFYGLLKSKRIVLYDTLLARYPEVDDEVGQERRARVRKIIPTSKKKLRTDSIDSVPSKILLRGLRTSGEKSEIKIPTEESVTDFDEEEDEERPQRASTYRKSMYDTGFTEYEIEALVARLMGSWVLGHSVKQLIFPMANLFLFFFIFSYIYENSSLFLAFQIPESMDKPIMLGLKLLYCDVMDIYKIFVEGVMKYQERKHQYDCDLFAVQLGYGEDLIDAYIEKEKENLMYPYYDWLYWGYHEREPSLLQRIAAIEKEIRRLQWKVE